MAERAGSGQRLRQRVVAVLVRLGFREDAFLILLGCLIGALTGVGSVGFTKLIELAHDVCYGGEHLAGVYGGRWVLLLVLPALGALLVGIITYCFAREAKGHGVPEVMDAIVRRDGRIRPRVALAKAVASALTIGSGGSAGTEGPIIQIGAALGSSAGAVFRISRHNLPILVGAGAAAGISAIFHAPIAGVLFALEIFLVEISFRSFSPVLMASVLSSVVVSAMLGENAAIFPLLAPEAYGFHWSELGNYVALGLICALAGVLFIRVLYGFEDFFDGLRLHATLRPMLGALALGGVGIGSAAMLGELELHQVPSVFGNGYPLIGRAIGALTAEEYHPGLTLTIGALSVLFAAKLLATCFTLGSGGSGGVFAPSLFLGAMVGYALGLAVEATGWFPNITPATYALVGMAAVVAATTQAPLAAILIVFELTRNYRIMLPVMFAATVALAVAKLMYRDSIYTLKLRRRGIQYETRAQTAVLRKLTVAMVMEHRCEVIPEEETLAEVIARAARSQASDFIVTSHEGAYRGVLYGHDLREALLRPESVPLLVAGEVARADVPTVHPSQTLDVVLDIFSRFDVNSLPIVREVGHQDFIGMVNRAALMRRYQQELQGQR